MNEPATRSFRESEILRPELFFGIVSTVGADVPLVITALTESLAEKGYETHHIKISGLFRTLADSLGYPDLPASPTRIEKISTHIRFGNFMRERFGRDILAALGMGEIINERALSPASERGHAYVVDQLKTEDELELVREVYGTNFFQISVYSARDVRVENLARGEAHDHKKRNSSAYRPDAEKLVNTDEDEEGVPHGQKVGKIFQYADLVISADKTPNTPTVAAQVTRFVELLFGSNSESPNHLEYGMYLAHSAALRSLDLSRQVGAAVFRSTGEIAALGSNEVPKAGGGTYWSDGDQDAREYRIGSDSNDIRKEELLGEVLDIVLGPGVELDGERRKALRESQFMDALEYGRIVHAEMCALTDAARLGIPVAGGTLYCTTFPCHMCAKHIVAAGIDKVVFLEPYPKSLTPDLHPDSVKIDGVPRGGYENFRSVLFVPFFGITPRRYRELFHRTKRKEGSTFASYRGDIARPIISTIIPGYLNREERMFELAVAKLQVASSSGTPTPRAIRARKAAPARKKPSKTGAR